MGQHIATFVLQTRTQKAVERSASFVKAYFLEPYRSVVLQPVWTVSAQQAQCTFPPQHHVKFALLALMAWSVRGAMGQLCRLLASLLKIWMQPSESTLFSGAGTPYNALGGLSGLAPLAAKAVLAATARLDIARQTRGNARVVKVQTFSH